MPDPFRQLLSDTLAYLKDPLTPKQPLLATAEEAVFFREISVAHFPVEKKKQEELPPPATPIALPPPPQAQKPIAKAQVPIEPPPRPQQVPIASDRKREEPHVEESTGEIKKNLQRAVPHLKHIDAIPDDTAAKKIAESWREKIPDTEVILLACTTDAETLELLKSLGKAIDQHLGKAKILPAERWEKEKRWDLFLQKNQFRLIVASDGLQALPELMRFYKALPATSHYFLEKTPLLTLLPASTYKSLEQKALLWKTLCQMLKK